MPALFLETSKRPERMAVPSRAASAPKMFPLMPMDTGISTNRPSITSILLPIPTRASPASREVREAMVTAIKPWLIVRRSDDQ
jgi:hypothetical protein